MIYDLSPSHDQLPPERDSQRHIAQLPCRSLTEASGPIEALKSSDASKERSMDIYGLCIL